MHACVKHFVIWDIVFLILSIANMYLNVCKSCSQYEPPGIILYMVGKYKSIWEIMC